jgi:thiamine transport system ATP-binding protein
VLAVTDLRARRGDNDVLRGVSLQVSRGERVAVHGPSGCGKTTLLLAIAGLVPVTSGRVTLAGIDVTGMPTHRRGVGMVFQDDQLFPHFNVAENVGYSLRVAGMPKNERKQRVEGWLHQVGLIGFGARSVDGLSGGEAKRVALARTLAASPSVVLLDEPLTGLDDVLRDRLLNDLRALFDELQTTVVMVTHDRAEAAALSHRAVEFDRLMRD